MECCPTTHCLSQEEYGRHGMLLTPYLCSTQPIDPRTSTCSPYTTRFMNLSSYCTILLLSGRDETNPRY
uniref:Uncharacterized protein n=1 Tax=Picea glauca TaxID=3330 RepID=A0A101LZK3_PICGL|nr:hypothetical protein ABT39_MTgene5286 [Picea glauca]QHR88861.1 hypothetical protein Q903MT_gene2880 [Picea sitchensis]